MTTGALPHTVEVRTLAAREVCLQGTVSVERMPRLSQAIIGADGPAAADVQFRRDEEGRYLIVLKVAMPVQVACQRCLEPMSLALSADTVLAALWSDDQAPHLPSRYDPLVTEAETDLWQVVEDELLLALPPFSYHDHACGEAIEAPPSETDTDTQTGGGEKDNPFSVLAALKGQMSDTD